MLSGETSVGEYPVHTVETMARIITATERHAMEQDGPGQVREIDWDPHTKGGVIAKAAAEVAERSRPSTSWRSPRAATRPAGCPACVDPVPLLAFTPVAAVRSQLALSWGVETFKTAPVEHTDEMVRQVDEQLLRIGRVEEGDLVVIIAGAPPGIPGSTNALRIHRMGDAINEVAPGLPPVDAEPHRFGPISSSSRATSARRETLIVFQFDCRHATPTRSSAQQHSPRMSPELLVNCQRG